MYRTNGLKQTIISLGIVAALFLVFAPSASAQQKIPGGVVMAQQQPAATAVNESTANTGRAFFRPESHWYSYEWGPTHGYYSEQQANANPKNYDRLLPRTPYSSPKRWLP